MLLFRGGVTSNQMLFTGAGKDILTLFGEVQPSSCHGK